MIVCAWKDIAHYTSVLPGLEEAIAAVNAITDWTPRTIPLSGGNKILVQQSTTKDASTQQVETHRNFLDIQYLVEGEEVVGWAPTWSLTPAADYNPDKDKQMYVGHVDFMRIAEGYCYVAYPNDGHMPGVHLDTPKTYRKLVIKLKV